VSDSPKIHHVFLMCHRPSAAHWDASSSREDLDALGGPEGELPLDAELAHDERKSAGGAAAESSAETPAPSSADAVEQDMASTLYALLRRHGYQVTLSRSPIESKRLLELVRPSLVVLDPLVCAAGAVEFELVSDIQGQRDPIPLIVLVDDLEELRELRRVPALFKDFAAKPFRREELVHRIELQLQAKERFLQLQLHTRKLEGQVIRDFKTGLYTERHFRHLMRQEFQRAERHRTSLSFLLLDVDDFKKINDGSEYAFGDFVLNEFAQILRRNVRDIDHSARFGGDEFMLLLPNTTTAEAVQVAARIRNQVARKIFDNGQYQMKVTVSIGLDTYDGRGLSSPDDLRSRANRALKEAKRLGKNRIWLYSGGETLDTRALDDEIDELSADRSN
jgi:two-component system cell cycle response regulator